jgi:phosphoribosyl-AMP cyclohydrolase
MNSKSASLTTSVTRKPTMPGISSTYFCPRLTVEQVEEGRDLAPKFDASGLVPAVTTDFATGELLMMGYMNAEALQRTLKTGEAHYFSRSRQVLWHKGATSGFVQKVKELRIDDDQDCVWLRVETTGGANCHVGYRSCFYRAVPVGQGYQGPEGALVWMEEGKVFDPEAVYGDAPNPTRL